LSFHFQHIDWLIGLVAIPVLVVLFLLVLRWKKASVKAIGDEKLVKELVKDYSPSAFRLKFILGIVALAVIIIGAANVQKIGEMDKVQRKGVDVMIALDVSKSMLATDLKPNRLEDARQLVFNLINRLDNDRVGLILFAGRAYLQMPLTTDHQSAQMYLQNAGPESVPSQGTVIGEALRLTNAAFNSKERKYKALVLITDGEDHDPDAAKVAQQLSDNAVMINTVGIGSPEGTTIPDPESNDVKKDELGNPVISRLNEKELQQLASISHGIYVRLDDTNAAVDAIIKQLNTIEQTAMEDQAFRDYKSYFQWFLGLALLLLIVEMIIPEKKWRVA
jgi:Ca-activated chloride channel homolog